MLHLPRVSQSTITSTIVSIDRDESWLEYLAVAKRENPVLMRFITQLAQLEPSVLKGAVILYTFLHRQLESDEMENIG